MAYKSLAQIWARDAMRASIRQGKPKEYIIYKYGTQDASLRDDWLHMSKDYYETVKHLLPIHEKIEYEDPRTLPRSEG